MNDMPHRLLIVAITVAAALLGVYLMRRVAPHHKIKDNHEFAGLMYQLLGLIYGVYLAFTIIAVWEKFGDAEKTATSEAAHLSELWRDVQVLPRDKRNDIQDRLHAYAKSVVDKEWPSMAAGKGADPETAGLYEDLWNAFYAVAPDASNAQQTSFYSQSVSELNELGMLRRLRLLAAEAELPFMMWLLLVVGGVLTIGFMFTFGTRIAATQYLITGTVVGMLVFSILMVGALEHPFSGDVTIRPDAFRGVVTSMEKRLERQQTAERANGMQRVAGPATKDTMAPAKR